jgi:hypothetical protein
MGIFWMEYHHYHFWRIFVVSLSLLLAGCTNFPLSKSGNSRESVSGPEMPACPVIPPLFSGELVGSSDAFHKKSTYTGPSGVLYSSKNNAPCRGILVDFYPNGRKKSEINYIDGLREGSAQWWAITGRLKHIRNYHKGQLSGSWTEYYEGSLQKRQEHLYDNGTEVMRRGWWPNGEKKFEASFLNGNEKSRQSWDALGAPVPTQTTSAPATPVNPRKQP